MAQRRDSKSISEAKEEPKGMTVPDFMKGDARAGMEGLGADDFVTPRLRLLQGTSPQVVSGELPIGDFFHVNAGMDLGRTLSVVPLVIRKRHILWRPLHEGGGILARAEDGIHWDVPGAQFRVKPNKDKPDYSVVWKTASTVSQSGLDKWGSSDPANAESQPASTLTYDIALYLLDHPGLSPVVFSAARTSIGPARNLNTKLAMVSDRAPIYGCKFVLRSVQDSNSRNQSFWNIEFKPDGFVADRAAYDMMKGIHEELSKLSTLARDEAPEDPIAGDGAADAQAF